MKKNLISLATVSLIATSVLATEKGVDILTTGQAVVYYQTDDGAGAKDSDFFGQSTSVANVGIQLNLDADLKNDFTFGSQLSYLGTAGLEKNLVSNTRQSNKDVGGMNDISDEIALTKMFIAKKIGNTTVKIGRQALPKSLSPLAFSETWNVFSNTFEAALVVNSDIPDTLIVGAYVGQSNNSNGANFSTFDDLKVKTTASDTNANVAGTAYMLTIQNKSLPMTTITASYYSLAKIGENLIAGHDIGANAIWADAKVADKALPMGLKVALQGGQISPDSKLGSVKLANTTALGAKIGLTPIENLSLDLAYTSVDGDDDKTNVAIKNTATGIKTPLYTQMILNQDAISLDSDTFMLQGAYSFGEAGKVVLRGSSSSAGKSNIKGSENDFTDLELIYKVKAGGVNYMAAAMQSKAKSDSDAKNYIRLIARYNF